ncbi:hypothetical protein D3C71_1775760 [compost metagenome]
MPRQRNAAVVVVTHFGDDIDALAAQRDAVDMNGSHWIFARHEVTPLDSKRKFWVWQPSSDSTRITRWRSCGWT